MARQSLIHYAAHCHTCGKSCEARNAQGWAHQHVNRNPNHEVELALGYFISQGIENGRVSQT